MKEKLATDNAEVGVVIGRFQVPTLHEVHRELIEKVIASHPRVLMFIGLAPDSCRCTYNNPLDYAARRAMIQTEYPNIEINYMKDHPDDDEGWSADLDGQIRRLSGPGQKVVLYGGRDSFLPHYKGKFPTIELTASKIVSGKEIRKNVGIKSKNEPAFREGVIWAVENTWPSALPTVDTAIIDRTNRRVLVAKRPNGKALQFVGGFASPQSDSYEQDGIREAREETGCEVGNPVYIGSFRIDDPRYRGERNKIKTTFFAVDYIYGSPHPEDDMADGELHWLKYDEVTENRFINAHKVLVAPLRRHLGLAEK